MLKCPPSGAAGSFDRNAIIPKVIWPGSLLFWNSKFAKMSYHRKHKTYNRNQSKNLPFNNIFSVKWPFRSNDLFSINQIFGEINFLIEISFGQMTFFEKLRRSIDFHYTEKSFNRIFLTERHLTETSFDRTPFGHKPIWANRRLTERHLTESLFYRKVIWPILFFRKCSFDRINFRQKMSFDRKKIAQKVVWPKIHLTESLFDRKLLLKMVIWPKVHLTESFFRKNGPSRQMTIFRKKLSVKWNFGLMSFQSFD
jgi:hypothetical protein